MGPTSTRPGTSLLHLPPLFSCFVQPAVFCTPPPLLSRSTPPLADAWRRLLCFASSSFLLTHQPFAFFVDPHRYHFPHVVWMR